MCPENQNRLKQIKERENSFIFLKPDELLPEAWRQSWKAQTPKINRNLLAAPNANIAQIAAMLDYKNCEFSGLMFPGFLFAVKGSGHYAPFYNGLLPWHSHPVEYAEYSSEDLLIFLLSSAPVTLLFSSCSVAFAEKLNPAWNTVRMIINKDTTECPRLLRMRRLFLLLEKLGLYRENMTSPEFAHNLGIKITTDKLT